MYIRRIEITNIRSIEHFEMTFPEGQEAGWHVLIGDNGAGKSTIVRSIAVCLVNINERAALRLVWEDWLRKNSDGGSIRLAIAGSPVGPYVNIDALKTHPNLPVLFGPAVEASSAGIPNDGFSVAYGPFRRFTGGSKDWDNVFKSYPKAAAHLSVFSEDVALVEALNYIRELYIKKLDKDNLNKDNLNPVSVDEMALDGILRFINESHLLPHGATIVGVNSETISINDGTGSIIPITHVSDGFRSILSLVLELLRQLILMFGSTEVFRNNSIIDLPGVVLIDEIDAHLHPTWQTIIGQWFTKHFPNIQFIVTTHSPLVCRAAEKGTIWRLPTPGSGGIVQEITGDEKKRLVFGNVLDAYGTNAFGDNVARSESANDKLNELAELNIKSIMGQISPTEEQKLVELRSIFPTESTQKHG